jgi:hypothetical protein
MEIIMTKFLPIIAYAVASETGTILTNVADQGLKIPHYAKEILDTLTKGQEEFTKQLAEWITFAGNMENDDGSNQVQRRLQFMANNMANLHHNQFYGNRQPFRMTPQGKLDIDNQGNKTFMIPTEQEMRQASVRFAAKQNLDYWESRVGQIIGDFKTNGMTEAEYADDFNYQAALVREAEARMWYNTLLSFGFWTDILEMLTGEAYIYSPYQERRAGGGTPSNVSALAASLKKS